MKTNIFFFFFLLIFSSSNAQNQSTKSLDSIIIKVGKSRVIVSIKDTADIRTLKRYDLEAMINEALEESEKNDTLILKSGPSVYKFKKFPLGTEWFELEVSTRANREAFRERAREMAERELEMLREQQNLLESESELDREELKSMIKDRAKRLKELVKEMTGDDIEIDFDLEFNFDNQKDRKAKYTKGTYQSTNFDFGTNNYLSGGRFPDDFNAPYTVRPFGSWYVAINNIYRTRLAKKFFLEWGLGLSAYNFKFQNDSLQLIKNADGLNFISDPRELDYRKSKLVASFVQASLVPVIDFGGNRRKPGISDGVQAASFRLGAGPYLGYRIMSYSKQYFKEDGDKQRIRNHDNFYLNNIRYGIRFQVGYRETDIFFCYDMNELFTSGKGPALNAFSFGISF